MLERLEFELECRAGEAPPGAPVVVGVLSSGNLEVLVEPARGAPGVCRVAVTTSARGFGEIWDAVLRDFADRHAIAGLALSVNDAGATPAVVTLRLAQALEEYVGHAS